jgi:protein required for attachment to host cells
MLGQPGEVRKVPPPDPGDAPNPARIPKQPMRPSARLISRTVVLTQLAGSGRFHYIQIDQGDWIVVCDGAKALVLENIGDGKFPNLKTREVYEQPDPKTNEQGTDAPGRSINSVGAMRSAVEQTDWHDETERAFLTKLAARLDAAINTGEAKGLIMIAPPRALGMIRQAYTQHVRGALRAEIDKDFVKLPVDEIEKHLAA